MQMIAVNTRQLGKFRKNLKLRKSQVKAIMRTVLNTQAFESRKESIKILPQKLNVRSKYSLRSIWVIRATNRNMQSEVGSRSRFPGSGSVPFHGLRDAELGATLSDPKINTQMSRISGLAQKNVSSTNRKMLQGKIIQIKSTDWRYAANQIFAIQDRKYPFQIKHNYPRLKKGVYRFGKRGKKTGTYNRRFRELKMIRDDSESSVREQRRPWLRPAIKKAVNQVSTARWFKDAHDKYTKPYKQ